MSRTLKFYGASDDLFEIEGTSGEEPDEIGCIDAPCIVEIKTPGNEGLMIVGLYAPGDSACWMMGIAPLDEDIPIPPWPVSFQLQPPGYSTLLTITVPDDSIVSQVAPAAE